jgi:ribosomal protein S18 acetylase RimI-like enzyme
LQTEVTASPPDIGLLEELNFNAWPALQTIHYDGWLLRRSGGQSRRVNSVNVVTHGLISLEEKVLHCEAHFDRWKQRSVFRITPLSDPDLDGMLADRGYSIETTSLVQTAETRAYPRDVSVKISDRHDPAWASASARLRGLDESETNILASQHAAIATPSLWASILEDGACAGVGVAAVERGWAGIHGIYVSKDFRRSGLARRISEALIGEVFRTGVLHAWLQVDMANAAALPLYASLGFQTAYRYHHRVRGAGK